MHNRRVVITGIGAVTSVGNCIPEIWSNLCSGNTGIGPITRFNAEKFSSRIAGEIKGFDVLRHLTRKEAKRLDPFCHYAIAASEEAITHSKIDLQYENREKIGVLIASGIGGICTLEKQFDRYFTRGPSAVSPFLVPMMIGNMASGCVAIRFNLKGPNFGITSACSAGTHAIGEAYWLLKRGHVDLMLAGGTEASISPICFAGFSSMKALSTRNHEPDRASRPFDADRDGFVLAEGAGVVVIELLEHAKARGATILAEIVGYGATSDAYHITSPPPDCSGAVAALTSVMRQCNFSPQDIDYINAHGTGTVLNDKSETLALKKVLGKAVYEIPVSSTKSLTGHSLGAAGAIETAICVKTLTEGTLPGTYNYENKDPYCDLNYIANKSIQKKVDVVLNLSFGFGGHNAVIALKKYEDVC